jgi:glycosyltransferase involved in cell wall biosynthesis
VKIIHCISSLKKKSGGTTFFVSDLSYELGKNGINVSLISQFSKNKDPSFRDLYLPLQERVKIELSEYEKNVFNKIFATSYRLKLIESIKKNVNIIHITGLWEPSTHAAFSIARKYSIPTIVSPQGMLEPWALNNSFYKKKIAWYLYQQNDLKSVNVIHATAEQEAVNLKRLGFKQPIAIIPNGVNIENNNNNQKYSNQDIYQKFNQKKNEQRKLLFLSRIHPKKGLIELVEAWDRLKPNNWKVIIAGPDENGHKKEVEDLISKKKLNQFFEFIGPVDGKFKYDLYRSSDLFVLPTYSENFGIVVAEALMAELPVITTKGAPWEGLIKNKCGWWIDVGADPLTKVLEEALSIPPEILQDNGKKG